MRKQCSYVQYSSIPVPLLLLAYKRYYRNVASFLSNRLHPRGDQLVQNLNLEYLPWHRTKIFALYLLILANTELRSTYCRFLAYLGSSFGSPWTESDGVTVTAGVGGLPEKTCSPIVSRSSHLSIRCHAGMVHIDRAVPQNVAAKHGMSASGVSTLWKFILAIQLHHPLASRRGNSPLWVLMAHPLGCIAGLCSCGTPAILS